MASSGKKRKVKGKTINLTSFLGDQDAPTGYAVVAPRRDWADYVEDEEKRSAFNKEEKIVLPTAPKAARGPDVDLNKIPSSPPFTAFVGNLPYDVMEEDIVRFFGNLNVISVRLPRDGGDRGRMRGFGYAEFEDKQSLIEALSLHQEHLKNRPIKVSLAGENENDKSGDRRNDGVDRTASDWRAAPRSNPRDDSFSSRDKPRNGTYGSKYEDDRAPYRGRNSYEADKDSYNGDSRQPYQGRRSYERDSRDYGFGRDRDGGRDRYSRDVGDRYPERDGGSGYNRRYGDRGFDSYDRDRDGDRGGNRRYGDRGFSSDDRSRGYGARGGGRRDDDFERRSDDRDTDVVKERPRLQLMPRSVPVEQTSGTAMPASASSIFGAAKPVDTAAKEREIEKRLEKEKKLEDPEKSRSSNQGNRYGDSRSSDDRSYTRRDREQKSYSDVRDSRPIRSNENSPRQHSPARELLQEPRDVDRSGRMPTLEKEEYIKEEEYLKYMQYASDILDEHSEEIPIQRVKGHSARGPHVEEESEPVKFLTNKFAHLSNQDEQDESD